MYAGFNPAKATKWINQSSQASLTSYSKPYLLGMEPGVLHKRSLPILMVPIF